MGKIFDALQKAQNKSKDSESSGTEEISVKKIELEKDDKGIKDNKYRKVSSLPKSQSGTETIDLSDRPFLLLNIQNRLEVLEQYRLLRSNIFAAKSGKEKPKCIMVTSPVPEEGKSTIACNLAISIALGVGNEVLLIDTDMRRPCQHQLLKIHFDLGLADYLLRDDIDIRSTVYDTSIERLYLMPSGAIEAHLSTELLASNKMHALLEEAKTKYPERYVVIDTPPCSFTSDPSVIVDTVDAIVMVVRDGFSTKDQIDETIRLLGRDKIVGIVFNCAEYAFGLKGYYHYYRRYYK